MEGTRSQGGCASHTTASAGSAAADLTISLILPVGRDEPALAVAVRSASAALARLTSDYEILVVLDGQCAATLETARQVAAEIPAVRVLPQMQKLGYGTALRAGFRAATKNYVGFTAADARLDADDVAALALLGPRADVICAARVDRRDGLWRRVASKAYSIAADLLLGTRVVDANGALKLFRRESLAELDPQSEGMFIHAELLSQARQQGLSVVEVNVPHRHADMGHARMTLRQVLATTQEFLRYWWTRVLFPTGEQVGLQAATDAATIRPWHVGLLLAVGALLLFTRLTFPLIEPDESRYALIAAGMLDSGDWLVPTREGSVYLDKPPLLYWLTLASYHVFGVHDYSARMVTALAGMGTLLATYFVGRRLVGARAALVGGVLLLMSLGFLLASRFLIMDGLLTCFTTFTLLSMYVATQESRLRVGWWLAASIACGLGVMTKGPIALVLTIPPVVAVHWLHGESTRIRLRDWLLFATGVVAIALPWFIAVSIREPSFLRYFFWEHHVMRYTTNMVHVEPWWFYGVALAIGMVPASFLLPILPMYLFRRNRSLAACRTRAQGFLLLTSAWTVGFFSLATGKLAPYILPALPPLCLLLGAMLDTAVLSEISDAFMTRMRRWIPFHGTRCALIAGVVLGVTDYIVDQGEPDQWAESILLIVGSCGLYWYVSRRAFAERTARWYAAAAIPLVLMAVGLIDIYPTIAAKRSLAMQVAALRHAQQGPAPDLVCYGRYEDSLVFYNRDTLIPLFNVEQIAEINGYFQTHGRVLILSQDAYIPRLREQLPANVTITEQPMSRGKLFLAETTAATAAGTNSAGAAAKTAR